MIAVDITLLCRSFGYGWSNDPARWGDLRPCVHGGLRAVEVERRRAVEICAGGIEWREALWVGDRRALVSQGLLGALIERLREDGRATVSLADPAAPPPAPSLAEFRVGRWRFEELRPPVPADAWQAVHDDYDGPEDHRRLATMTTCRVGDPVDRMRALRDLLDEVIDRCEEDASALPRHRLDLGGRPRRERTTPLGGTDG